MSFGSETGRTRSGTKGFSNKEKKQKRKKQEFHAHRRAHLQETGQPDPEAVRARTILALDRLGHQVLSTESGGYDLDDWMKSFNSLLDDFQEKVGTDRLTTEFHTRRQEALGYLAPRSDAEDIDSEIAKVTQQEEEARAALDETQRKAAARLATLREERDICGRELKTEKERLAELKEADQSRQFFSRLRRSGASTAEAEARVAALESKLKGLEDEIERSRKGRAALGADASGESDSVYLEAQEKLEAAKNKLVDLQSARQSRLHLTREREIAAKTIAEIIASMKINGTDAVEGGTQEQ